MVPFDWHWSKNRIWLAKAGSYARRMNPLARDRRDTLAALLLPELRGAGVVVAPLWLRIHCALPDHRGDALNVLDLVADAVQQATGLDDRWYQLAGLTWELAHEHPELQVWIGQEATEDAKRPRPSRRKKPVSRETPRESLPPPVPETPGTRPPWLA